MVELGRGTINQNSAVVMEPFRVYKQIFAEVVARREDIFAPKTPVVLYFHLALDQDEQSAVFEPVELHSVEPAKILPYQFA